MKKRNDNSNSDYTSQDRYPKNQINNNNNPLVYSKNNFRLYNHIDAERKYQKDLNLGRNNYQARKYNANYRYNIKVNNINSDPINYVCCNSLGNLDIKKSNEDNYRRRYSYSHNNKKNAGD